MVTKTPLDVLPAVQSAGQPWLLSVAAPLLDSYADAVSKGIYTMGSFSADMELGVESELIDLGAISMTVLRELDDTVFRQALRHVMQQTAHPRVSSGSGSAERVD